MIIVIHAQAVGPDGRVAPVDAFESEVETEHVSIADASATFAGVKKLPRADGVAVLNETIRRGRVSAANSRLTWHIRSGHVVRRLYSLVPLTLPPLTQATFVVHTHQLLKMR